MQFIEPVFDRTLENVNRVVGNIQDTKGALSFEMLNRIENNCSYLSNLLDKYGYRAIVNVKLDWTRADYPTTVEMERIRQNVIILQNAYHSYTSVPLSLSHIDYIKANEIERILYEIKYLITHMEDYFIYSGVANLGQNRLWQQRFRRVYELSKTWEEAPEYEIWQDIVDDNRFVWRDMLND